MQHVYVHKDIGSYEEKVVGKLGLRMLACISCGIGASVVAGLACHFCLGVPVADASAPIMAASMPFWLLGFWKPCGLRPERFLPLFLRHVLGDGRLLYTPAASLAGGVTRRRAVSGKSRRRFRKMMRKVGEAHGIQEETGW